MNFYLSMRDVYIMDVTINISSRVYVIPIGFIKYYPNISKVRISSNAVGE